MICQKCNQDKPISEFPKDKNRPNPRTSCKTCRYKSRDRDKERKRHREYMREKRKNDPVGVRQAWERSKYGVCKEDMDHSSCQICGGLHRLSIDHNHDTGEVRGLLCSSCNIGLGMFNDNQELLIKASSYLAQKGSYGK